MSIPWTVEDIVAATDGQLVSDTGAARFAGVSIDSRGIRNDQVFVAIAGQRHDGHSFLDGVIRQGVKCVIVSRDKLNSLPVSDWQGAKIACIAVNDTTRALGLLGAYQRERAGVPVAAITGSNGKTTTKEMAAKVLGQRFSVLATYGNLNNEIGLPLTLLELGPEHQAAVVEMGMNHPGEIRYLSGLCQPDIGMITNIGPAHLEGLGSIEAVAKAKAEMLENIRPGGTVVLNADDAWGQWLASQTDREVIFFGCGPAAQIRAENIAQGDRGLSFTLIFPDAAVEVALQAPWGFMVYNALAAAAVGYIMDISADAIGAGLADFRPISGRMAVYQTAQGAYIIDDTYNANPGSMETAIRSLAALSDRKRGILVAGDMLELGEAAAGHHEDIGRLAAGAGVNRLYLSGEFASRVAYGARSAGMKGGDIFVGTKADIIKDLEHQLGAGDWVLVKGSRSTGMDEIVARLTAEARIHEPDITAGGD